MKVEDAGERGISVIKADVSYKVFLDDYLRPLKPCIISGLTDVWTAAKEWTIRDSSTGKLIPNFSILKEIFGKYECCVTFCDETDANGDIVQREMSVLQFIDQQNSRKTYLKDFHFMRANPSIKQPYSVSKFFQDDWYNRFAIASGKDDFRFLYLGEDLSSTPLHHDVCMSHSWSTSLCGTKIWTMIPPEYTKYLSNPVTGAIPKSIDHADPQFPYLQKARAAAIIVPQFPGETVFVTSGWYHQVVNHGPTLSLNHNWFNAACLRRMYDALCIQYTLSRDAIGDLRNDPEYEGLVQGLLKANWGMDWDSWWEIVEWNLRNRGEDVNRMDFNEEKYIVLSIVEEWLKREEVDKLLEVKMQVMAFRDDLGKLG